MDMHYLFVWHIVLDQIQLQPQSDLAASMTCFLSHATTALHPATYAGDIGQSEMFPNIIYDFQPHNGWPGAPNSILIQLTS